MKLLQYKDAKGNDTYINPLYVVSVKSSDNSNVIINTTTDTIMLQKNDRQTLKLVTGDINAELIHTFFN